MNYYISDLHLFHEASIRFDNRPFGSLEEMHEAVVSRWNNKVNNGDTVYILGDMSMRGKKEDLISLVAPIPVPTSAIVRTPATTRTIYLLFNFSFNSGNFMSYSS